jgi:hypothetical protein
MADLFRHLEAADETFPCRYRLDGDCQAKVKSAHRCYAQPLAPIVKLIVPTELHCV